MPLHDLTHLLTPNMPVYPGTEPPELSVATTVEREGFQETLLRFFSHTGTHMDAPGHMISGAPTLDRLEVNTFAGSAVRVDLSSMPPGSTIPRSVLVDALASGPVPDFVLLSTGWDRYWGTDAYFSPFPTLSADAATYLASLALKGVGVDVISVDPLDTVDFPIHKTLLAQGFVLVENLRHLQQLPSRGFTFFALPLRYIGADGAPVRAVALLEA